MLGRAGREFPSSESVRVFRALTLNEAGRADEAISELLGIVVEHAEVTDLGRYADPHPRLWAKINVPVLPMMHRILTTSTRGGATARRNHQGSRTHSDAGDAALLPAGI